MDDYFSLPKFTVGLLLVPAVIDNKVMTKLAVQNLGRAIVSQKQNLPEKDTSQNSKMDIHIKRILM